MSDWRKVVMVIKMVLSDLLKKARGGVTVVEKQSDIMRFTWYIHDGVTMA